MRKLLKETQWKVTLTTAGAQSQTIEKNIEAPTQDAAIRRAIQSFPGLSFVTTMATSLEPQQTPPGAQTPVRAQQQLPRQMAGLRPLQGLAMPGQQQQQAQQQESLDPRRFRYPYTITLPVHFARLLNDTSPVIVTESEGQHRIILENAAQMQEFLARLGHNRNRNAVGAVVNGLRSSLR